MSNISIDKATITNIVAALIVIGYIVFMIVYPDKTMPPALQTIAQIAFGWFFATGSISVYQKMMRGQ